MQTAPKASATPAKAPQSWPSATASAVPCPCEIVPSARSGRILYWLKIKNPAAPAVMHEAEKGWRPPTLLLHDKVKPHVVPSLEMGALSV